MLSGPHQKFAEGVAAGCNASEAYRGAYPNAKEASVRAAAARLLAKHDIKAEIVRIRAAAENEAGSAKLTLIEVHAFLASVVRARPALLEEDSALWQSIKHTKDGVEYRLPDKLGAIARWCDLQSEGSEAGVSSALTQLLAKIRK